MCTHTHTHTHTHTRRIQCRSLGNATCPGTNEAGPTSLALFSAHHSGFSYSYCSGQKRVCVLLHWEGQSSCLLCVSHTDTRTHALTAHALTHALTHACLPFTNVISAHACSPIHSLKVGRRMTLLSTLSLKLIMLLRKTRF